MAGALYDSAFQNSEPSRSSCGLAPECTVHRDAEHISVRRSRFDSDEWERVVTLSNGSFFCSRSYLSVLKYVRMVVAFELFDGAQKIGQCALARKNRWTTDWLFLDTLMLLPGAKHRWIDAMAALLRHVGPGRYRYGSVWAMEPRREQHLQKIPGVSPRSCWRVDVQAVDFRAYPGWEAYEAAVSHNVRRNVAKARRYDPDMRLQQFSGWRMLLCYPAMVAVSREMYQRKGWPFGFHDLLHLLCYLIVLRRDATVSWAVFNNKRTAFIFTVRTGENVYYLRGASLPSNGGSAWYLLLETLRQAYLHNPSSRFFMGCEQVSHPGGAEGGVATSPGVARQRLQCRVSRFPTSRISFEFKSPLRSVRVPQ